MGSITVLHALAIFNSSAMFAKIYTMQKLMENARHVTPQNQARVKNVMKKMEMHTAIYARKAWWRKKEYAYAKKDIMKMSPATARNAHPAVAHAKSNL
jgi:hypothetical protein